MSLAATSPRGKTKPWISVTASESPPGFDLPADPFKAWKGYSDALTYWLPHGLNRAQDAARRIRRLRS